MVFDVQIKKVMMMKKCKQKVKTKEKKQSRFYKKRFLQE